MKSGRKVYMPRKCEICGKMFVPPSPGSKFCSRECRAENERRRSRRKYAESHLTAEEKETKKRVKEDAKRREAADKRLTIKAGSDPREYARKQTADTIEKFARIDLTAVPAPIEPPRERETVKVLRDTLEAEQTNQKTQQTNREKQQTNRKTQQTKQKAVKKPRQTLAERFEQLKRDHEAALLVCDLLKRELEDMARAYAITR